MRMPWADRSCVTAALICAVLLWTAGRCTLDRRQGPRPVRQDGRWRSNSESSRTVPCSARPSHCSRPWRSRYEGRLAPRHGTRLPSRDGSWPRARLRIPQGSLGGIAWSGGSLLSGVVADEPGGPVEGGVGFVEEGGEGLLPFAGAARPGGYGGSPVRPAQPSPWRSQVLSVTCHILTISCRRRTWARRTRLHSFKAQAGLGSTWRLSDPFKRRPNEGVSCPESLSSA
jgi:hypothetical protein